MMLFFFISYSLIRWIQMDTDGYRYKIMQISTEQAGKVIKEASSLDQTDVPLDFLIVKTAIKAHFRKVW